MYLRFDFQPENILETNSKNAERKSLKIVVEHIFKLHILIVN